MRLSSGWRARTTLAEGSCIRQVPVLGPKKRSIVRRTQMRGLLRLPVRVGRPGDVFNLDGLNVRRAPGRRILLNAIPKNGLCAPTRDTPENAECNAPDRGRDGASPVATPHRYTRWAAAGPSFPRRGTLVQTRGLRGLRMPIRVRLHFVERLGEIASQIFHIFDAYR